MKKLIPAICMLLVAASLLGTSTYAWFSMNTTVTATGMQVQATASKNLSIKGAADTAFSAVGKQDTETKNLVPVSVNCASDVNLSGKKFYKASSDGVDYSTGILTSGTTVLSEAVANTDYRKSTFTVRAEGSAGQSFPNVYVSAVTVTNASDVAASQEISKALRVAVSCTNGGTSYTYIFAPTGGTYTDGKSVSGYESSSKITTLTAQAIQTAGTGATIGELEAGDTVSVDIYVWYEGNDTNCTSANGVNVETLKVQVQFTGSDS